MVETGPRVTVVIVNYNAGAMLIQCLQHVFASTVPVQVMIADNASTDDSLAQVASVYGSHPAIRIYKSDTNRGFSVANNSVYDAIVTPFIFYLNPDCLVAPETIATFLNTMDTNPEAGMAGCLVTNMDGNEQRGCRGLTPTPKRVLHTLLKLHRLFPTNPKYQSYLLSDTPLPDATIAVELISGCAMFVRKEAIAAVGLLDENYFLYCEDYDWFYRFTQSRWKILFTAKTKVVHFKGYSTQHIPFRVLLFKARGMWRYHNKFFKQKSSPLTTAFVRLGIITRLLALTTVYLLQKGWGWLAFYTNLSKKTVH